MIHQFSAETRDKIAELCRQHKVRELSIFGSRGRGDHSEASDYDLLVDFFPDVEIGLIEFSGIQIELEEMLGKKVDLVPKKGLKERIRDRVLAEAKVIYEG